MISFKQKAFLILSTLLLSLFCFRSLTQAQDNYVSTKTVNVIVLDFNPTLQRAGGRTLVEYMNWSNQLQLESQYIQKLKNLSGGYAEYNVVTRVVIDGYPALSDGYIYNETAYFNCLTNSSSCHQPQMADYRKLLNDYGVCDLVNSGEIEELWLWGGPWFGYWEATTAGTNAFFTNGPIITGTTCNKILHIMGFNYERGVSEMIEDFGHRFEGTMRQVFTYNGIDYWNQFTRYDLISKENASCGNVHFPPNGVSDYDWNNANKVTNDCEDWLNYPNLTGTKQIFGCERWGCTGLGWKEYWLSHIPKSETFTNNTWDNWWKYVLDYQVAITTKPQERRGDINEDGAVNLQDLNIIVTNFYTTGVPGFISSDINLDGKVDIFDYNIVIWNFDN